MQRSRTPAGLPDCFYRRSQEHRRLWADDRSPWSSQQCHHGEISLCIDFSSPTISLLLRNPGRTQRKKPPLHRPRAKNQRRCPLTLLIRFFYAETIAAKWRPGHSLPRVRTPASRSLTRQDNDMHPTERHMLDHGTVYLSSAEPLIKGSWSQIIGDFLAQKIREKEWFYRDKRKNRGGRKITLTDARKKHARDLNDLFISALFLTGATARQRQKSFGFRLHPTSPSWARLPFCRRVLGLLGMAARAPRRQYEAVSPDKHLVFRRLFPRH